MNSTLDRLEAIGKEHVELQRELRRLEGAPHVPRPSDDSRILTPLTACAVDCPTCMQEQEIGGRMFKLGDIARDLLLKSAQEALRKREDRRRHSSNPRNRPPTLTMRGLKALLSEFPEITARQCIDILEEQPRPYDAYDEDGLELSLIGKEVRIRDLETDEVVSVKYEYLSTYLRRARNT